MDAGSWIGLLAGAGGGIAAVAAAVREYLATRHKHRQEDAGSALAAWQVIVDRQQAEVDLLKRHGDNQQHAIGVLFQAHSRCENTLTEWHGWLTRYHGAISAIPGAPAMPEPPARPPHRDFVKELEFLTRSVAQDNALIKEQIPVAAAHPAHAGEGRQPAEKGGQQS